MTKEDAIVAETPLFPGFDAFYLVREPLHVRAYVGALDLEEWRATRARHPPPGDRPTLDYKALLLATVAPDRPLTLRHVGGRARPSDVIWSHAPVLGPRALAVLRGGGFTGWRTWPVTVYDRAGAAVPGYAGLAVTGRCGPWDVSRCREVVREFPYGRMRVVEGFRFDLATWDGSDLFIVGRTTFILVTEPVAGGLRRARIRNLRLVRLTEWSVVPPIYRTIAERSRG